MMQIINKSMTPEQFVYWLQGFLELSDVKSLSESQVEMIKAHLGTILYKTTPTFTTSTPNTTPYFPPTTIC